MTPRGETLKAIRTTFTFIFPSSSSSGAALATSVVQEALQNYRGRNTWPSVYNLPQISCEGRCLGRSWEAAAAEGGGGELAGAPAWLGGFRALSDLTKGQLHEECRGFGHNLRHLCIVSTKVFALMATANSGTLTKLNTRQECYSANTSVVDCTARTNPNLRIILISLIPERETLALLSVPVRSGKYDRGHDWKSVKARQYICIVLLC